MPDGPHDVVIYGLLRAVPAPERALEVRGEVPAAFVVH